MDKDELLLDIIHSIDRKVDKISKEVDELTSLKNKALGVVAVVSVCFTVAIEYLKNLFAAN